MKAKPCFPLYVNSLSRAAVNKVCYKFKGNSLDTTSHAINMFLCNIFCFTGCFHCPPKYGVIEAFL